MRTVHILDWRRTRQEVVLQKFALPVKGRFNPFLHSAGCTIVMRWQPRLKSNFSEDQTLFFEPLPRSRSHSLRAIFRRSTTQPAIQRRAYVKWKEIFLMPAQRFGERQGHVLARVEHSTGYLHTHRLSRCHLSTLQE